MSVSGLSAHTARAARSYEAQGPYNRYSSTLNVSADRYEGENEKDRNEKRDEKRDRKHGVLAALFNSRTDGKSLARMTATLTSFIFYDLLVVLIVLSVFMLSLTRASLATINLL